jgi:hypothetical protein
MLAVHGIIYFTWLLIFCAQAILVKAGKAKNRSPGIHGQGEATEEAGTGRGTLLGPQTRTHRAASLHFAVR